MTHKKRTRITPELRQQIIELIVNHQELSYNHIAAKLNICVYTICMIARQEHIQRPHGTRAKAYGKGDSCV